MSVSADGTWGTGEARQGRVLVRVRYRRIGRRRRVPFRPIPFRHRYIECRGRHRYLSCRAVSKIAFQLPLGDA
jgi:hypothetical protein